MTTKAPRAEPFLTDIEDVPAPGTYLEERYEVRGTFASGGVGHLLRAKDHVLGREVAIKLLQRRHAEHSSLVQRFLEEGQIAAQLEHPGIVPVHEIGMAPDGRPFLVMKLVQGQTLAALLTHAEREPERLVSVFVTLCHTVAYAHARDVIHRDLKPANIMVGEFGEVQVMDWGMAKVLKGSADGASVAMPIATLRSIGSTSASVTGSVMGTFAYMAPEQARGATAAIDRRTDVFSLGAILCELLTGEPPYRSDSPERLRELASAADLADARERLGSCGADPELVRWAGRCLEPAQEHRPEDAGAVARALESHLEGARERARAAELAATGAQARAVAERRARHWQVGLVLVAALTVGGSALLWLARESERRDRADRIARTIEEAMESVRDLRARAQVSDAPEAWLDVTASARRACDLAQTADAPAALVERTQRCLADAVAARDEAQRGRNQRQQDADMLRRLRELPSAAGRMRLLGRTEMSEKYHACFLAYGLDLASGDRNDLARRIQESAIAEHLVDTLSQYTATFQGSPIPTSISGCVHELVETLDQDAMRVRVRAAARSKDGPTLLTIADAIDIEHAPRSTVVLLIVALCLHEDCREAALRLAQQAYLHDPGDFWLNRMLAGLLAELRPSAPDEAIRFASNAASIAPDGVLGGLTLAIFLGNAGRLDEAERVLLRLAKKHADVGEVHGALAYLLLQSGRGEPALAAADASLSLSPRLAPSHIIKGNALELLGRLPEAKESRRRGVEACPDNIELRVALAGMLVNEGDETAAQEHLRAALELPPRTDDPAALASRGTALIMLERTREAIEAFRKALALDPNELEANLWLGKILLVKRNTPAPALEYLQRAYRHSAVKNVAVNYWLGEALVRLERFDEALPLLKEACRLDSTWTDAWSRLGQILLRNNLLDEAEPALRKAVADGAALAPLFPIDAARARLAECLARQGKHAEAQRALKPIVMRTGLSAASWAQMGTKLLSDGHAAAAEQAFAKALEIEPGNELATAGQSSAASRKSR